MLKETIRDVFSRPPFQAFFENILNTSLKVMNIGEGQLVETSGEKIAMQVLEKMAKDEVTVFDVGAHTGEWVKLFETYYTKKARVYSFEPSLQSYEELKNIKRDNFYPENLALGEKDEKRYLSYETVGSSTSSIIEGISDDSNNAEEIQITTLDAYCEKHDIHEIDLLKLDIEGYELKALSGARRMLRNGTIKLIQFEFGAPSEEKYTLKDFFNVLGDHYRICRILKHGYYPLPSYKHYYEIMTVTNFIAIRKDLII